MKITLKRTEEQVELVKAMASRNREVAYEAQMALAEFIGPVLAEVVNQAPTLSNLFTNFQFNDMDSPSIPLDLYYDVTAPDYVKVYSTSVPGGLPTNTVTPTASEMKFTTYRLDSAVDFDKRYAAKSRLDVVGKSFTRIAQERCSSMPDSSCALYNASRFRFSSNVSLGRIFFFSPPSGGGGGAIRCGSRGSQRIRQRRAAGTWPRLVPPAELCYASFVRIV